MQWLGPLIKQPGAGTAYHRGTTVGPTRAAAWGGRWAAAGCGGLGCTHQDGVTDCEAHPDEGEEVPERFRIEREPLLAEKVEGACAVGETSVILLHPPSPFSKCFNRDAEGASAE